MTPTAFSSVPADDARLVEQSLAGDRQAFAQIVARYQSLVCALAYSATGSRSHSEDLAQETFLAAWRKLRDLREPGRLRAWLCGIARNVIHGDVRRLGRQPAHAAETLEGAGELVATEPPPTAEVVSREEMAILWREVGRLPEIYREPLVLFYREHKSVEAVAAALELTPDAVMQRLTRGRRQLHERMLQFVEATLERTNPDARFTLQVHAALPVLAAAGPATAMTAAAAKGGGVAAKSGALGFLLALGAPFIGVFAAIGISWTEISQAPTARERRFMVRWTLVLWSAVLGLVTALYGLGPLMRSLGPQPENWMATAPYVAVWFGFAMITVTLIVLLFRGRASLHRRLVADGQKQSAAAAGVSGRKRVALNAAFLTATFWALFFLAWQSGDRAVAGAIVAGVFLLGAAPFWLERMRPPAAEREDFGGWYIALCGLVFLGLLNWRLEVWLAPMYDGHLEVLHRVLPMAMIHGLSVVAVAWTAALVFLTRPDDQP